MNFEIIDFHTHPFLTNNTNICLYKNSTIFSTDNTLKLLTQLGVSKICGSVISVSDTRTPTNIWERLKSYNDEALKLAEVFNGKYYPGLHIHPDFLEESIKEIDRFYLKGYKLIGELTPYLHCYTNKANAYNEKNMQEILDYASQKSMILNIHPSTDDDMDLLMKNHPNLIVVGAHPNEGEIIKRHILRAKKYKNYYIDVSGSGIARYGCAKHLVDEVGAEKVLFGSDYPICNMQMYVDSIKNDLLLSNDEKRLILSENAKKLLNI